MPWKEVNLMDSKILFISDWIRKLYNFSELCRKHGISRKTGYKWLERYREDAAGWFKERSRRPLASPRCVPEQVRKEILWLKKRHGDWGARKIAGWLTNHRRDWAIPSATTIYKILRNENLVEKQKRRRRVPPSARPFAPVRHCNELWTADFKGQFAVGDGSLCYPLTVMDHKSRYLLACVILPGTRHEDTQREFERLFAANGLPERIRTDNGVPFASTGVGGLSKLSTWWVAIGVKPERIEPGCPEQNGQHERMHRTLKKLTAMPPARTLEEQQKRFDRFRREYNEERPHEALGQMTPSSIYEPSQRKFTDQDIEARYPPHYRVVYVNHNGCIRHKGRYVYIGYLLRGRKVGLEEIEDQVWEVYFFDLRLGRFQENSASTHKSCASLEYV